MKKEKMKLCIYIIQGRCEKNKWLNFKKVLSCDFSLLMFSRATVPAA